MKNHDLKFIFLFIIFPFINYAQTGPGGVGKADGTSTLDIWLSDTQIYSDYGQTPATNNGKVQQWNDLSGNNNNALETGYLYQPIYNTNTFNGFPALEFGASRLSVTNYDISPSQHSEVTIIAVADHNTATSTPYSKIFGNDNGNYDRAVGFDDRCGGAAFDYFGAIPSRVGCINTPLANTPFVMTAAYTTSTFTCWFNGDLLIDSLGVTNGNGFSDLYIGSTGPSFNEFWNGAIAEFIVFGGVLNKTQYIIIQNYLAAKYNLTLAANKIYVQDNSINGNYDFDVAGIGRTNASDMHNDAQGSGMVRILNPTNLGDDEFLFWGHDNGVANATNYIDIPATLQARFDRIWRVSETSTSGAAVDVGSIDIRFDLTGLGNIKTSDLRLLIDTDNDGHFNNETPISGATSLGNNIYQFAAVSAIANNLRFTLGTIDLNTTPLPIELVNFNLQLINDNTVKIDWQTASESNNDYFTIERSINGVDWKEILNIDGAGNSSSLLNYYTYDENPILGLSYYRLKQTDFNGEANYSQIKSISIGQSQKSKIVIHPNPAINKITVEGDEYELKHIQIYNILGQDITVSTIFTFSSKSKLVIDISKLNNGIYFLKTKNTVKKIHKQ